MESTTALIDNDQLMEMVRKYPALYDKKSAEYRDAKARLTAWTNIETELCLESTPGAAQRRYNTIRTRFGKYLKDIFKSGSRSDTVVIRPEYEKLRWLINHINPRTVTDSIYRYVSNDADRWMERESPEAENGECDDDAEAAVGSPLIISVSELNESEAAEVDTRLSSAASSISCRY